MKVQTIVDHIKATEGWYLIGEDGLLRNANDDNSCPLQSWTGLMTGYLNEAKRRGFKKEQTERIMAAADCAHGHDPRLRKAMLAAAQVNA